MYVPAPPVSPSVVTIIWLWTLNLKASLGVAPKRNYDVSVHFTSSMPLTTFLVQYILLWHNGAKVFMKSHFNVYKFTISRKTFKCFYFCYSRKFLVKSSITIFKYDFRIGLIPIVHGLFHLWNHGLVAFYKIILAFVLYLCLILNQIIIMPEPNSSNGWKMGMTSSMYITWIFYFHYENKFTKNIRQTDI